MSAVQVLPDTLRVDQRLTLVARVPRRTITRIVVAATVRVTGASILTRLRGTSGFRVAERPGKPRLAVAGRQAVFEGAFRRPGEVAPRLFAGLVLVEAELSRVALGTVADVAVVFGALHALAPKVTLLPLGLTSVFPKDLTEQPYVVPTARAHVAVQFVLADATILTGIGVAVINELLTCWSRIAVRTHTHISSVKVEAFPAILAHITSGTLVHIFLAVVPSEGRRTDATSCGGVVGTIPGVLALHLHARVVLDGTVIPLPAQRAVAVVNVANAAMLALKFIANPSAAVDTDESCIKQ